jgi:GAF domain-containing protein
VDERRRGQYERIHVQLSGLIQGKSPSREAAMATICAVLHAKLRHHFWTGFYHVRGEAELHVGPYQGPVACQTLTRGVCLDAARSDRAIVVEDVTRYPGHMACDARAKSEIAIPVRWLGAVIGVLDVDSSELAQFTEEDIAPLERILSLLEAYPPG